MIVKAYSFLDTKVGLFSSPFFFVHEGHAIRAALEIGSDVSTAIGRHPADFILYLVGEFNDNTGLFTAIGPVSISTVLSLLPVKSTHLFQEEV